MRVLVLDNDSARALQLKDLVLSCDKNGIVKTYSTPFSLVTAAHDEYKGDIDLVIIHLTFEEMSLIGLGRDLQSFFPHIKLIFYSENNNLAEEIFVACPIYFIKLPFNEQKLGLAMERVKREVIEDYSQALSISSRGQRQRLRFSKIKYVESIARKIYLYTDEGGFDTYMTMEEVIHLLNDKFIRCHRSFVVNVDRVVGLKSDMLILNTGEQVPVSRTYKSELKRIISI